MVAKFLLTVLVGATTLAGMLLFWALPHADAGTIEPWKLVIGTALATVIVSLVFSLTWSAIVENHEPKG